MPEPTPTTDVVSELKPGGKQFPKWGYFAIGGAVIIALLIYKSKKSKEEGVFQPAETGGQNLEENFPVSGGGGLGAANELQKQNTEFLEKYLNTEKEPAPKAGKRGNQEGRTGNKRTETKVHNPEESRGRGNEKPPVTVEVPKAPPPEPVFTIKQKPGQGKPPKTKGKAPPKLQPVGGGNRPLT